MTSNHRPAGTSRWPANSNRPPSYEAKKARAAAKSAADSRAGRDVAPFPPVKDPQRRLECTRSFQAFCKRYFPHSFTLDWSMDHRRMIDRIETAVLHGGMFAMAMPRGSGKTTMAETASVWALLIGARQFVCLIGSDEGHAQEMLDSIKIELSGNDLLYEDFPEVIHPIRRLEGIAHRANAQLFNGERTHIVWGADMVVLPTVRGSKASGGIIRVRGLGGGIRGMKYKRSDGKNARPDIVIIEDPQTDESARSPSQCTQRKGIITGAVMGLGGPGKKIAAIMPCTVIEPEDLADQLLDRNKHPEWQGERTKLMYAFPHDTARWDQYAQIRSDSLRAGNGGKEATEYYRANREAMDAGAQPAWPVRFNPDEVSATQHAMNLRLDRGEAAFNAEYQNDPSTKQVGEELLSADEISKKTNGLPRGIVPLGAQYVTAFIDVQDKLLYYLVAAWGEGFTGSIIDIGSFPDQKRPYFSLADARRTLSSEYPTMDRDGRTHRGLKELTEQLVRRKWISEDDTEFTTGKILIDANWGESTDTVKTFCRTSEHSGMLMPAHGRGIGASSLPMDQYTKKPGEVLGHHWYVPVAKGKRVARHVLVDTNYWKSFIHSRIRVAVGSAGSLTIWGRNPEGRSGEHRMIGEQFVAEYPIKTFGRGRTVMEWKIRPGNPDNHLLDCAVGAAAAASMLGLSTGVAEAPKRKPKAPRTRRKVYYMN